MHRILFPLLLVSSGSYADSVAPPAEDNTPAAELASFKLDSGYSANLFASEEDGIANPIAIRFDPQGRLWVLCSQVYPQIVPGEKADDHLVILEDTDGDGRADTSKIFASKLDMPTGFALGNGGVYLGEGTDLVFLADTDGDDVADFREVLFSGFGTGDTHQNINSFTWSPGGELLFCQGLHCFSRVETPWGIEKLDEHGVWRLRPKRLQFHAFRGCSGQNPWGIVFGQWGEPFVKGNNTELSELLPVMVPTDHYQPPLDIGATRIKAMIAEIIDSPHFPDDIQGDVLIAGYFAHDINRHGLHREGAGHKAPAKANLLSTPHRSFRPVDIQTGPDGALYVADWYNPIIGHYQASFRHPDRDKTHGRIWRITADGRRLTEPQNFANLPTEKLFEQLGSAPLRERERIRIELSNRDPAPLVSALKKWIAGLKSEGSDRQLFEAIALCEWNEIVEPALLERLLTSENPLARAYATRVAGRWYDRLEHPLHIPGKSISDPDPRVRLEAVVACGHMPFADALPIATRALNFSTDRFLNAGLRQTVHALKPHWWPALQAGTLNFDNPHHLAFALAETSGNDAAKTVRALIENQSDLAARSNLLGLLATIGSPKDLDFAIKVGGRYPETLRGITESSTVRGVRPTADYSEVLADILTTGNAELQVDALRTAGALELLGLSPLVLSKATSEAESESIRSAAIESLGKFKDPQFADLLTSLATDEGSPPIWKPALGSLVETDAKKGADVAAVLLGRADINEHVDAIVTPFLTRTGALPELAISLAGRRPKSAIAEKIRTAVSIAGRLTPEFEKALTPAPAGGALIGIPAYDAALVAALTKEANERGNPKNGAEIFVRARLTCAACHKIGDTGGVLGPDLSAVGAGVPTELIVEAILWPERQIKEGYLATTVETKSGNTISGYVHTEDKSQVTIRDAATGTLETVATSQIQSRKDAGTLMPPALTAGLKREELRDLIRYLADQKGG